MDQTNPTKTIYITLSKEDSSFLYFTFESNEGLGFYSTLDHVKGAQERVIRFSYHTSLENEVFSVLEHLKKKINFSIEDQAPA